MTINFKNKEKRKEKEQRLFNMTDMKEKGF